MVCCVRPDIPFHVEHPFLSEQQARFFLGFVCLWGFVCFVLFICLMLSVRCFQVVSLTEAVDGEALVLDAGSWHFSCIVSPGMVGE